MVSANQSCAVHKKISEFWRPAHAKTAVFRSEDRQIGV
jgi:hypothetical protein